MRLIFVLAIAATSAALLGSNFFGCHSSHPDNVAVEIANAKQEFTETCDSFMEGTGGEAACMVDFEKQELTLAFDPKALEKPEALETLAAASRLFCKLTFNKGLVRIGPFATPLKELSCNGDPS